MIREHRDVMSKVFHPQICMCPAAVAVVVAAVVVAYLKSQFQKVSNFPFETFRQRFEGDSNRMKSFYYKMIY